ncbi:MAG: GyrI-like domain-containing protein [Eudoraea sp.]|nr:GyrI-like domain-containing protein [Eudoraea sp.]
MQAEIEHIKKKKLLGRSLQMSLEQNTTYELFSTFMPRLGEIANSTDAIIYDLRVYPDNYFTTFDPTAVFTKWALKEVVNFDQIPANMHPFILEAGNYAVFKLKGENAGYEIFEYLFKEWLPNSDYRLDTRPHFDKLVANTHNNHSETSESIYIPVISKR